MSGAAEILDYAKQAGWIDIAPGVRFATREYLQKQNKNKPHVVETSPGQKIEIMENVNFDSAPYWFFVEPENISDKVQFYSALNNENALIGIELIIGNLSRV